MAATDDEWERLFRQRLENYESEPDENALDRILGEIQSPTVQHSGANSGNSHGWSLALLGLLIIILCRIGAYWDVLPDKTTTITGNPPVKNRKTATVFGKTTTPATDESKALGKNQPSASSRRMPDQRFIAATEPQLVRSSAREKVAVTRTGWRSSSGRETGTQMNREIADGGNFYPPNQDVTEPATNSAENVEVFESRFRPIANRQNRLSVVTRKLPAVHSFSAIPPPQAAFIEPKRQLPRPVFRASVMPLYTFRALTPVRQDEIVMEKIRPATDLSSRSGWRVQIGAEWEINRLISFRAGLVYQQLQQQLTYTARALRSDSSKVEWIDSRTIKLTPLYKSEECQVDITWRYVALSAEGRLQLNPGAAGLRHYLVAGGSVGYLMNEKDQQNWQPFFQASYGIEHRLTPNLRLQVEPGIVYNLRVMQDNSQIFSVRPYSYGLTIGVRWQPKI